MDSRDIRKWVENHRAAEARVAADARQRRLTPAESFAHAMSLLAFDEAMNGDPFQRKDPVSEREDQEMWDNWDKLRRRWGRGR